MSEKPFHHRSQFKVPNKPFKGKSKAKARKNQAKNPPRKFVKVKNEEGKKWNRLNRNRQLQKQKREEVLAKKRLGSKRGPPKIVAIIPLSPTAQTRQVAKLLADAGEQGAPSLPLRSPNPRIFHLAHKEGQTLQRFILYDTPRDELPLLDIAKVADIILAVVGPHDNLEEPAVDPFAQHMLTLLKAQGYSSVIGVMQSMGQVPAKKEAAYKRNCTKFLQSVFDDEPKVLALDDAKDAPAVLRWMSNIKIKGVRWRENRTYMLADWTFAYQQTPGTDVGARIAPTCLRRTLPTSRRRAPMLVC